MRHAAAFAVVMLAIAAFSAGAEEKPEFIGKWAGKNKEGKAVTIEFKDDKSVLMTEEGKDSIPPGGTVKWELKDAEKGHLDLIMKVGEQEMRLECLIDVDEEDLKLGGPNPKTQKRAAKMEEADDPVELKKAK
jgi:hypothetical protein